MAINKGLLVNVDRCFGCYACEVACQQEHGLPADVRWMRLHTVGPAELDGELAMDFLPQASAECDFCGERTARQGPGQAACVVACPASALVLAEPRTAIKLLRGKQRFQVCKVG